MTLVISNFVDHVKKRVTDEITPSPRMMRFLGLRKSRTKRIFTYLVQIYSTSANLFTWSEFIRLVRIWH